MTALLTDDPTVPTTRSRTTREQYLQRVLAGGLPAVLRRRPGRPRARWYEDYIFGMLFLKRCSDEFEAAYQREYRDALERGGEEGDARAWAENPDTYIDLFYVPRQARWDKIKILVSDIGTGLNKALGALEHANEELAGLRPRPALSSQ